MYIIPKDTLYVYIKDKHKFVQSFQTVKIWRKYWISLRKFISLDKHFKIFH